MKPTTYVQSIFGEGGTLASVNSRYSPRPEQIGLAGQIALSLIKGDQLFVSEAPCGTGKTFAYLVPLLYHFVKTGDPILISTAGIGLQQQLISTDLPFLIDHVYPAMAPQVAVARPPSYRLLKGISNYVCLKKKTALNLFQPFSQEFTAWLGSTKTGDREEAPGHTDDQWQQVSIASDDCNANTCPKRGECHYLRQRNEALKANILVMNHHLLAGVAREHDHPFLKTMTAVPPSRGMASHIAVERRRLVVLDEAHEYPSVARQVNGFSFRPDQILKKLTYDPGAGDPAEEARVRAVEILRTLAEAKADTVLTVEGKQELAATFRDLKLNYNKYRSGCESEGRNFNRSLEDSEQDPIFLRLAGYEKKAAQLDGVCVREERGAVTYHGVVTSVRLPAGPLFALSATLRYDGKYDSWCDSVSAKPDRTYTTPSPFLWPEQAMIVVPGDAEDPTVDRLRYQNYLASKSAETVLAARGRTLVLCSSWTHVRAVADALRPLGYPVLVQGDAGKQALVERFKSEEESVLVGTVSMWTGVDVPGPSLSALVIDKLPFRTNDDPTTAILKLQDSRGFFSKHVLPETVSLFAQGFGRLIRSTSDRGVAVILDKRIQTARYGALFFNALPEDARYSDNLRDAAAFLQKTLPIPLRDATSTEDLLEGMFEEEP
jgi:ATP-dependent DNA helicase DinG